MTISFDIPPNIEQALRSCGQDLSQVAKEAALVELYRQDRITQFELAAALGLSRYETDGVLKRHGVTEDLLTVDEFERQVAGANDGAAAG